CILANVNPIDVARYITGLNPETTLVFGKFKSISLSSYLKGFTFPFHLGDKSYPPIPNPPSNTSTPLPNTSHPKPGTPHICKSKIPPHPRPCPYRGSGIPPSSSPTSHPNPTVPPTYAPNGSPYSPSTSPSSQLSPHVLPAPVVSNAPSPGNKGSA
ncbi:unnamed protein product, partial [Prunus brigantina]